MHLGFLLYYIFHLKESTCTVATRDFNCKGQGISFGGGASAWVG